jgi:hypothetical protein
VRVFGFYFTEAVAQGRLNCDRVPATGGPRGVVEGPVVEAPRIERPRLGVETFAREAMASALAPTLTNPLLNIYCVELYL